ncbi:MAG: hypothetical protein HDT30_10365 [Clostridiales bacterium]|nr:hypothetical protein [Clostridiales bacterium]
MKFINLLIRNILHLAKKRKYSFVVVMTSITVISYGVLFYAGYLLYYYYIDGKVTDTIHIELNNQIPKEEIQHILASFKEQGRMCIIVSENPYREWEAYGELTEEIVDSRAQFVGACFDSYEGRLLAGEGYSIDEEKACLLVSSFILEYGKLGRTIGMGKNPVGREVEVKGHKMKIIGTKDNCSDADYEVPINYYIDNFKTKYIQVSYIKALGNKDKERIKKELESFSGVKNYHIESQIPALLNYSFWLEFGEILLIFLIMTLNLFFILLFWIRSEKRKYNIYAVLGCSKRKRNLLLIAQNGVLLLAGEIIGGIIYMLTCGVLSKLEIAYSGDLSIYVKIQGIYYLLVMVFLTIVTWNANRKQEIYVVKE